MRRISILGLLLCVHVLITSQHNYTLTIFDTHNQPMRAVVVTALNKNDGTASQASTNDRGTVTFKLYNPGTYSFSYLKEKDVASYEVEAGTMGKGWKTVTYDPNKLFATQKTQNRNGIEFSNADAQALKGRSNAGVANVEVRESNDRPIANFEVTVTDCVGRTKYKGKTNASGFAKFYLPVNRSYEIDIAGVEAAEKFNMPNYLGVEMNEIVVYQKPNAFETIKGDTIFQKQVTQKNGTSTHLVFSIHLVDFQGNALDDEDIYACAENKKRIYAGKTDNMGNCKLMLEKGCNYIINLNRENGVHLVDMADIEGLASESISRRYRGTKEIDLMMEEQRQMAIAMIEIRKLDSLNAIKTKRRIEEIQNNPSKFIPTYKSTPIFSAQQPLNYLNVNSNGFSIEFNKSGELGTPTVAEGKLFNSQGYYSPNFYCFDAQTGKYIWGVTLGESGISPVVYHKGVLIINTESCSIYAIDAKTGKLLWSKWLTGDIWSTPSADDNNVYAVYNTTYSNLSLRSYVITCFDLYTGKIKWINWVDSEVIACPVIEGNTVHVASYSGKYYVFDKLSGKIISTNNAINAISSPTITPTEIFVTTKTGEKEEITIMDKKTLKIKKRINTNSSSELITQSTAFQSMNFNGAHPIVYKNMIVSIARNSISTFDGNTEKALWKKEIQANKAQIPIVANDKIIVGTAGGILSLDIYNGNSQYIEKNPDGISGQPVYSNGFLYISTGKELQAVKSNQNLEWNQWNKDAGHNVYCQ